jgi:hypothetical protein
MHTLTGVATDVDPVDVPDDGDGVTGASVEDPDQAILNKATLALSILRVSGVYKLKTVANTAALKSVTGMATDDFRYDATNGLYRFNSLVTPSSDDLPWIVKPASGGGQWEHIAHGLVASTPGLAIVGLDGKVVPPVPWRTIAMTDAGAGAGVIETTTNTVYTALTAVLANVANVQIGDKLHINFHGKLYNSGAFACGMKLQVTDDAAGTPAVTAYDRTEMVNDEANSNHAARSTHVVHTATKAGTCEIKLQMYSNAGGTAVYAGPTGISVIHVRP